MSRQWYPHYPGDYGRETGHLSLIEDGAYRRLLDHYYSTGQPLPAKAEQLHRICRAVADAERDAVDFVVHHFFTQKDGVLHNERADRELQKSENVSKIRKMAANKRHGKADAKAPPKADAFADTTTTTVNKPPKSPKGEYTLEFLEFWKAYPRKIGKGAAFKAWKRIKSRPGIEELQKAIHSASNTEQWQKNGGEFIPHPSTWLNQRRWEDEPTEPGKPKEVEPTEIPVHQKFKDWDMLGEIQFKMKYKQAHMDFADDLRRDLCDLTDKGFGDKYKKSKQNVRQILEAWGY